MINKIITFLTSLFIFISFGCRKNAPTENTNRSSKITTTISSYFNEVKGFEINSNYNLKQPIQKLNLKYNSLTIKLNYIADRAYLSIDKENNTFIDWKPIKINFNYDVSFEDTEKDIHLLLQNNNFTEGYLLFPTTSNESVKYTFYYFTIEKLEYIGEYEYYPFKEGNFIYYQNKQELYILSDKEYRLTKKEGKENNNFPVKIVEKDLQLINTIISKNDVLGYHNEKNLNGIISVNSTVYAQVKTYLNVRSAPSSSGEIIGKAYPTDKMKVLEVLDGWLKVSIRDVVGYVSSDFVDKK